MPIPAHLIPVQRPIPDPRQVVQSGPVRITVLTSGMLRLEHSPSAIFEDRPSLTFWHRQQPVPAFSSTVTPERIEIDTGDLLLTCQISPSGFSAQGLAVLVRSTGATWHFGDSWWASDQLYGTTRTLDRADGHIELENGLFSRRGWAVFDDSRSVVFRPDGWVEPRTSPANTDLYFFGFGQDFQAGLRDLNLVCGQTPLIPRYILGNWWSRYWAYTQSELQELMQEFAEHEVPLSVCIIDMDWHLAGWTGYTWNPELWPDPQGAINWLHEQGLHTALNLHPSDGVGKHEAQFPAMCAALGLDPAHEDRVPFDIANPDFAQAYFERLHHPYEAMGVDFWWMDWQQERVTAIPGLDPLFWLNHLHYLDLARDGRKRSFIFSRWGGLGNHRYPIGFSGDTEITWASLRFQPYFTATAANVGYGWWSHDIGGHMGGFEDDELYVRWVQFGVFSPILRLHSTKNPYHERVPWRRGPAANQAASAALRLRHRLIPYIYTMAHRNTRESIPLIVPMYHTHPEQESAYQAPNQYWFGSELVAAPFTTPTEPTLGLARQRIWLPEGDWFHFFSPRHYRGGSWIDFYGTLEDLPVFARAGAIIPLAADPPRNGTALPAQLDIHIFPGAANDFTLLEDDGETTAYLRGEVAETTLSLTPSQSALTFTLTGRGELALLPATRQIRLCFHHLNVPQQITVTGPDREVETISEYNAADVLLKVTLPAGPGWGFTVTVSGENLFEVPAWKPAALRGMLRQMKVNTFSKYMIDLAIPSLLDGTTTVRELPGLSDAQAGALESVIAAG